MKKLLYSALALGAVFGLASCSSDGPDAPVVGDGATFTIRLPKDMQTRATFGDQSKVQLNNLQWTIYDCTSGTPTLVQSGSKANAFASSQTEEQVTLPLVKGHKYQVTFYADNAEDAYASYSDGKVNIDYSVGKSNDKEEDCFVGKSNQITVTGGFNETVTLTRPYSQLNWGTNDLNEATVQAVLQGLLANVKVSGLYKTMDVLTGEFSDPVSEAVTFPNVDMQSLPAETFPVEGYTLIAMNYLLCGNGTVDCSLNFNNGVQSVVVNQAPVKVNYRTNIYGALLTAPGQFNIVVDPNWVGDYNIEVPRWDGTSTKPGGIDDPTQTTISITSPAEFAGLRDYINAGNDMKGREINLTTDIDLGNRAWIPIGTPAARFKGKFKGNSHKIKNLYVNVSDGNAGLFGACGEGNIQGLTLENVHVTNTGTSSSYGTGALAGDPFTSSVSDITVTGEIQVEAFRYAGGLLGHNAYGNVSNITIAANHYSYVKATNEFAGFLSAPNHCGGVVGYVGEGNTTLSNITSNLPAVSMAPGVGGIAGCAQAGNKFVNCSSSANILLNGATTEKNVLAIGGIAGITIPGSQITFTGCSFTGTVKAYLNGSLFALPERNNIVGTTYGGRTAGYGVSGENVLIN